MENRPQSRYEVQDNNAYFLQDFFLFCAGVDTDLLSQCPKSERVKHAAIGATVFFTGLLAMEERMRNRKLSGEVCKVKVEKEIQSNSHIMDVMLAAHKEMFQASVNQWVNDEKARFVQKDEEPTENPFVIDPLNQPVRSNGKS